LIIGNALHREMGGLKSFGIAPAAASPASLFGLLVGAHFLLQHVADLSAGPTIATLAPIVAVRCAAVLAEGSTVRGQRDLPVAAAAPAARSREGSRSRAGCVVAVRVGAKA
jgi:hypothetical protein